MTEPTSSTAIFEVASQVFSREELRQMSRSSLLTLGHLLEQRMLKGPPPTHNELLGIKELVLEYLSHPALDRQAPKKGG